MSLDDETKPDPSPRDLALAALYFLCAVDYEDVVLIGQFDGRGVAFATSPEHGDISIVVAEIGEEARSIYLPPEAVALLRAALSLSRKEPT